MMRDLVNTTAFVLAILYGVLFGVLTAGVFVLIYWMNTSFMDARTRPQLDQETQALMEIYSAHGLGGLTETVRTRSAMAGLVSHHYLLVDLQRQFVAGNLTHWPENLATSSGMVEFQRPVPHAALESVDWDEDEQYSVAAQVTELPDGHRLLIGYSLYESSELREQSLAGLIAGSLVTISLGLIMGAVLGRTMLRRIDAIDRVLADIMAGDLSRRVEVRSYDEFGQLSSRINLMLDRLERTVTSLREIARNLSLDMRTPLYRLRGRLERLQDPGSDVCSRQYAQHGLQDVDSIVTALDDLLDVTRTGDGCQVSLFEEVDMTALASEVAERYVTLARHQGLNLSRHIERGVRLRGIPNLLSQSLAHLLGQAVTGTPAGGNVEIRLMRSRETVDLLVGHCGPLASCATRAARSFGEVEGARAGSSSLELSVVGAIAKLHGARLILEGDRRKRSVRLRFNP